MPKSKAGPPNIREAPRVYVKDNAIGLLMHSVLARERLVILDSPFTVSGQESCKVSFTYNGHVFAGKQIFNPGGGPLSPPNAGLPMGLHYPLTPSGAGCDGPCATAAQPGALERSIPGPVERGAQHARSRREEPSTLSGDEGEHVAAT